MWPSSMSTYLGINGIKRSVKIDTFVLILNSLWVYVGDDDIRQWSEFWRFVRRKPSCEKITVNICFPSRKTIHGT